MAAVGQGLSVAGGPGPSAEGGAVAPPLSKAATTGTSKGAGKAAAGAGATATAAAAATTKSDKSSSSPQRHGIQKTMSK